MQNILLLMSILYVRDESIVELIDNFETSSLILNNATVLLSKSELILSQRYCIGQIRVRLMLRDIT